ncbi:alpha-keto acid decarboxylase family protein [Saccharibacillus alkalitolerans]|uniref:Alpha-keto-acid decarboxylase n=1 Tax=Saccharibacillus alkalitolerans TaxID=2705290 RepID=A0ABX0F2D8_9BACL|nr:thiamine pyrophosphate-binding protein [Saccharibacillus alkalitolerans]NGZ75157.1 alpha-keto acid decarboxylase family protein [Saccharibacillus alkalitolerans]
MAKTIMGKVRSNTQGKGKPTLGTYLFDCLRKEGVTEVFGVPGDYNFTLFDTLEEYEGIKAVPTRNELNGGYAADGYARVKGLAALITTFGVGELSAVNAIAGAYSENVPIVHIVGSPKSEKQKQHKLMHHTLMDGDYDAFRRVYEPISAYTAVLTPDNAMAEIPKAISIAKRLKKPVYLSVAIDLVQQPISIKTPKPEMRKTNESSLKSASKHARKMLKPAKKVVLLSDAKVKSWKWEPLVREVAEKLQIPAASTAMGKGGFDESHPNHIGMYGGAFGSQKVREIVESADCLIVAGFVPSDINLASETANLNPKKMIIVQPESVSVGGQEYTDILGADMLRELAGLGLTGEQPIPGADRPYNSGTQLDGSLPLAAKDYYPLIQRLLQPGDIIVAETGTFAYGLGQTHLPQGATYIAQGGWQSIGYATPAALGACMAAPRRRVLLFTGDGSLQLTAQELSSMMEYGCKPIVFVLNNGGYTIEKYLNFRVPVEDQPYNEIPGWNYVKLVEAFGGGAYAQRVRTIGELARAFHDSELQRSDKLCLIEMMVPDDMDAPEYLKRMSEEMEKQESGGKK